MVTNSPDGRGEKVDTNLNLKSNGLMSCNYSLLNLTKTFIFLIWQFIRDLISCIYSRPKVIDNQVVLITGSAGYLGRQLACEFAKNGAIVILWDFNSDENNKTCNLIHSLGYKTCRAYKVDLTCEVSVRECAKRVKEKYGFVSILVLAAAVPCEVDSVFKIRDSDKLHKVFKLFYESHLWMYQEFLPTMIEKNHGHLVVISSETVFTKLAFTHMYSGMKTAQAKLFECVDAELNFQINNKVNTSLVYLGGLREGISTEMLKTLHPKSKYLEKFGLTSEYASKCILKSILKNKKTIFLPFYVYIICFIRYFLPGCISECLFNSRNFVNNEKLVIYKHSDEKTD
jgi:all-trans-retinol dehydrogenase (NAD+)